MKICLYGSASEKIDEAYKTAVYKLATEMAKRGHVLVFGGGCQGLMGAAARGMHDNGGEIIGVAPDFFKYTEVKCLFDDCNTIIPCQTMYERKQIMEETSDAFIVTPGGIGTYDEFFGVLATRQLKRHNKPIALFNVSGFFNKVNELIKEGNELGFIGEYESYFINTDDIKTLLDYLEKNC